MKDRITYSPPRKVPASAVKPYDVVDFQGDRFADPNGNGESGDGHTYGYEYEYAVVEKVEAETPNCTVIYSTQVNCGFPPDHLLTVVGCYVDPE